MKMYYIMMFLITVNVFATFVNGLGIFSDNITISTGSITAIGIGAVITVMALAAAASLLSMNSLMAAVYGEIIYLYWSTYVVLSPMMINIIGVAWYGLLSTIYTFVFLAGLAQMTTGGWGSNV